MIPVLGIPVLNRYDLLWRCLSSIDHAIGTLFIVDNGGGLEYGDLPDVPADEIRLVDLGANIGVAPSWNLIITATVHAPWWAFVGADTEFGAGELGKLAATMDAAGDRPQLAQFNGAWTLVGFNAACVELVGFLDPHYTPAYCEDCDYMRRARLAGVEIVELAGDIRHLEGGSVTIREAGTANGRTYPAVVGYHTRKWGGGPWHEVHTLPYGTHALDMVTLPSLSWLRAQAW